MIIHKVAEFLQLVQAVDARNGLKQFVLFQRFVDVQHHVARFVEAREELAHHDEQFRIARRGKVVQHSLRVLGFRLLAHFLFPPADNEIAALGIHFLIPFAAVRRGDDHGGRNLPQLVEQLLVADGRRFAGTRKLPLHAFGYLLDMT